MHHTVIAQKTFRNMWWSVFQVVMTVTEWNVEILSDKSTNYFIRI